MKKCFLGFLTAIIFLSAFAQEASSQTSESKDISGYQFKISIPDLWKEKTKKDDSFSYDAGNSMIFDYIMYPYDSSGAKYKDYSVFSESDRKKLLKEGEDYYTYYYMDYDYDLEFTESKYETINGRTFMRLDYNGVYYDYYMDDYDYEDVFEVKVYSVLKDGNIHSFTFDSGYDYFTNDQTSQIYKVISSIVFK
ncbi:MAG: hypothetical protein PHW02_05060 [bacterium]|nr:hypothetical protein [bacterium]